MKNTEKSSDKSNIFEQLYKNYPDPWSYEKHYLFGLNRIENTIKHIPKSSYINILDLGCGNGYSTNLLSNLGEKIIGVDISLTAIKKARFRLKDKTNCEFIVADIRKLPFKPSAFDLIVCIEVLSYFAKFSKLDKIITDLISLNVEGGIIIFAVPVRGKYFKYDGFLTKISTYFKILAVVPVTSRITYYIDKSQFIPKFFKLNIHEFIMQITRVFPKQLTFHLMVVAKKGTK